MMSGGGTPRGGGGTSKTYGAGGNVKKMAKPKPVAPKK
jgi:hypothetical protein